MYEHLESANVSLRLGPGGGPGAAIAHAKFVYGTQFGHFNLRGDMGV